MRRVAGLVLAVLTAGCGVVYGADGGKPSAKTARWDAVEALPPNALIEVRRAGWAGVDECRVESSDDNELTCVAERPDGDSRLVLPRYSVVSMWVIEAVRNLHIGRWIVLGVGVALLIALGVEGGVAGLAFFGPIIVGIEASYFEFSVWRAPPEPPRLRRRLVYAAPKAVTN
jgi:hypothetical protein